MKRRALSIQAMLFLVLLTAATSSQAAEVHGFLKLDSRVFTADPDLSFINREDILQVGINHEKSDFRARANVRAHYFDQGQYSTPNDLSDRNRIQPLTLEIWEAQVDLFSFLVDGLDVRLGKQQIAWGTGDGINPTNYLATFDLSDPIDFTQRLPAWAVRTTYYLPVLEANELRLEAVWLPKMTPILAPPYGQSAFGGDAPPVPQGLDISGIDLLVNPPAVAPKNSMYAFKAAGKALNVDWSMSYQRVFHPVPQIENITLAMAGATTASVAVEMGFPRMHVVGADFATELFGFGFWGEGAYIIPSSFERRQTLLIPPDPTLPQGAKEVQGETVFDERYSQFVLGADFTFSSGLYTNLQFARGLFFDTSPNMKNYLMTGFEYSLLDTVKLSLTGGTAVSKLTKVKKDELGYFGGFGLEYLKIEDVSLQLEQFIVGGKGNSPFAALADFDQLKLVTTVKF